MFRLVLFLLFCFSLSLLRAQASDYGANFAKGLQAYQEEKYEEAARFYEAALKGDLKSAQAYNNLGLAYHKAGDIGKAVLNFERALRQNPSYAAAKQNLRAARQLVDTNVKAPKGFWLFKAWEGFVQMLTSRTWIYIFWVLLFLGLAGLSVWYIVPNVKYSRIGLWVAIGLLSFALLPFFAAWRVSDEEYNSSYAIVTGSQAGIRTAPGLDGEDIMVVSSGVKARITEQTGDWFRVRLDNGVWGWIPAKAIEKI